MPSTHQFTVSVFIGISLDGFIARPDGGIDWLTSRAEGAGDYGYDAFTADIDTVVMGRATYEVVTGFGPQMWPYDGKDVHVLSTQLDAHADDRITVHRDFDELVAGLDLRGAKRIYADGGQLIQTFLQAGLVSDITITRAPVLIGSGLPLFGPLNADIDLTHRSTRVLGAGFTQSTYSVAR
ncbi:dihydrofolate reductase family protein [Micromonospora cremea]|uniref:Dihydrofolate reductase n=1 Tax=Micromonospora cremea TaxID=709881 RepID=A0A1N5UDJ9_9ACTN|nr:dihydrofolate reductase family protein [Micromonospora cremea]SIM58009.1 Dihydrofolate reductase [Micromonospora cremea]